MLILLKCHTKGLMQEPLSQTDVFLINLFKLSHIFSLWMTLSAFLHKQRNTLYLNELGYEYDFLVSLCYSVSFFIYVRLQPCSDDIIVIGSYIIILQLFLVPETIVCWFLQAGLEDVIFGNIVVNETGQNRSPYMAILGLLMTHQVINRWHSSGWNKWQLWQLYAHKRICWVQLGSLMQANLTESVDKNTKMFLHEAQSMYKLLIKAWGGRRGWSSS